MRNDEKQFDLLFCVSFRSVFIFVENCNLFIYLANSPIFLSNLKTGRSFNLRLLFKLYRKIKNQFRSKNCERESLKFATKRGFCHIFTLRNLNKMNIIELIQMLIFDGELLNFKPMHVNFNRHFRVDLNLPSKVRPTAHSFLRK